MERVEQKSPSWLSSQEELAIWYSSPLGESIIAQLDEVMRDSVHGIFGYQGLQIGNPVPEVALLDGAELYRTIILDAPGGKGDVFGDVLALPFAKDSMKSVLFFHTLDFCGDPHKALREADRVLSDDGQLIIVGFNPFSLFGIRHWLGFWRQRIPWNGQFYSRRRVGEWLSVLDYAVEDRRCLFMRPPWNHRRLLQRLAGFEPSSKYTGGLGGLYILRARKQSLPMTMHRSVVWQPRRSPGLAASYSRNQETLRYPVRATVARIEHYRRSSQGNTVK